jgi:guanosine-3',5'-bis(diphosphate) 3'-pyrophosphohydrolase
MGILVVHVLDQAGKPIEELAREFGPKVASIVAEVTDDDSLPKAERKRRQVERAPHISPQAKLVKLADKTCNVRDMASQAPQGWELSRRREYFDWAKKVVDQIRGTNKKLEAAFDEAFAARP